LGLFLRKMYLRMYSLERVAVRVRVFNMVGYESNVVRLNMRTSRVKEGRQEEFERSRRRQDPHLRNGCQRLVVKCVKCTGENLRRNLKKKA